jgi:hypothetical protein
MLGGVAYEQVLFREHLVLAWSEAYDHIHPIHHVDKRGQHTTQHSG